MGLFTQRKPRGFQHKWIYVDERKEKLKKIEEKAKRDLGILPEEEEYNPERLRGTFIEATTHLKRRKENKHAWGYGALFAALFVMLFILHYLVTGSWSF